MQVVKGATLSLRGAYWAFLSEEALRTRARVPGKRTLSTSSVLREIVGSWIASGCQRLELEPSRPTDLEPHSLALTQEQLFALEEAAIQWSHGRRTFVDRSMLVRALIDRQLPVERTGTAGK